MKKLLRHLNPFNKLSFTEYKQKRMEAAMQEKQDAAHAKKMAAFTEHMAQASIDALIAWEIKYETKDKDATNES